jgi:hypothetical protein
LGVKELNQYSHNVEAMKSVVYIETYSNSNWLKPSRMIEGD